MLIVICYLLFVICYLLYVDCCLLSVVCCRIPGLVLALRPTRLPLLRPPLRRRAHPTVLLRAAFSPARRVPGTRGGATEQYPTPPTTTKQIRQNVVFGFVSGQGQGGYNGYPPRNNNDGRVGPSSAFVRVGRSEVGGGADDED